MAGVFRKTEIEPIDGTPVKRMFWSIISDYNLKTALSELVDNALDVWMRNGATVTPKIEITLDPDRQLISVIDNAGGVGHDDLKLLVAPGGSKNDPNAERIGIFGVGSKRAGIALGEQVEIRTRLRSERSLELDITKEWLESEDWELAAYEIPEIAPSTTQIDISRLRRPFIKTDIGDLRAHIGETYGWFIDRGCSIEVNEVATGSENFEQWAYPPNFPPRVASFEADFGKDGKVLCEITVGLIIDRDPKAENYGAYFYCNHRLVVKELRTRDVGYHSEIGVPHPDVSLCRAIVRLQGPAALMPWNSTKSGINIAHPVFERLRPTLVEMMVHFSSLSRRLKDDRESQVFQYESGKIEKIEPIGSGERSHLVLPPLPRVRKTAVADLKEENSQKLKDMPWTLGLVEAIGVIDVVRRQKLQTKNRIALILLDSNFEIALKEFIVHRTDLFPKKEYGDAKIKELFGKRHLVVAEIRKRARIPENLITIAEHYYEQRNKLIHERATMDVVDKDIENYRSTIEQILAVLFGLSFST
ncbi:ATP-binding protein [Tardiphaga sp. OK245]|uniref:ATP-binding protein n=1 Tax=Tardiphaga sp. OK245 TaxID=1855306 RepID=UPI0008A744A1|nr:ATP-binding protein [Tardiphaga sp. OK245]SEI21932.1 Histidine kinase-, DNA gyrase B-, and HSP90-like ATPase [Tardiphaga sp. OK245]